jgi:hypothetical protein
VIFSRDRGKAGKHARSLETDRSGRRGRHAFSDGDPMDVDDVDEPQGPSHGPYDVSQAPDDGVDRLDLGALRIPAVDGVEVRVQADAEGQIQQIVLVHGDSALQLGAFAAPRTEGIWEDVRADIRKSLFADGVAAEEVDGEYGVELRARVRNPDGPMDIRFVGVDGPRWFVRGVYQGAAAVDPTGSGPLREALRGLVVDRGSAAMPVRETLPLRLPPAMAAQAAEDSAKAGGAGDVARPSVRLPSNARSADPVAGTDISRSGINGAPVRGTPRRKQSPKRRGA